MIKPKPLPGIASAVHPSIVLIRSFDSTRDTDWAHQLWHRSFDPKWYLQRAELGKRLTAATVTLVAERNGLPIGVCAVGYKRTEPAGLLLIMVEPSFRNLGFGRRLLTQVEEDLRTRGVRQFNLGFGSAGGYFWPGAPEDQLSAWSFFCNNGWNERERSFDLFQDLRYYRTPSWVHGRLAEIGISLSLSSAEDTQEIVSFERSQFPVWAPHFEQTIRDARYLNILLARTKEDRIVGSLLLEAEEPILWNSNLGERCGSLSVLGVAADQQGHGIGSALAARAMEIVQERGGTGCYIQWTGLVDWYGKLGAKIWGEYRMSSKQLL